jgi:hypothetical protein
MLSRTDSSCGIFNDRSAQTPHPPHWSAPGTRCLRHSHALQKTLAELKLLAKEKFDQINMDKEKEGGLTAEEAAQLDQQILALENSLKVLYCL